MATSRDHNKPVPINGVGKALTNLKKSMESWQRKVSRFPQGEMVVLMTCRKKDKKGQEAEEWVVFGSEALQRAFNPYLSQIQEEYMNILEEEETSK